MNPIENLKDLIIYQSQNSLLNLIPAKPYLTELSFPILLYSNYSNKVRKYKKIIYKEKKIEYTKTTKINI